MATSLLRTVTRIAYPGQHSARLPVLMYHRVLERPDALQPGVPDAAQADAQFSALARLFKVMPMEEAAAALREDRLPARAACITFDDGYRDNHDVALPLLKRHGLTATFYIASGFLDGGRMWNDTVLEAVRRIPSGTLDLGRWGIAPLALGDGASRSAAVRKITGAIKYFDFERRQAFCDELSAMAETPMPADVMMDSDQVLALAQAGMSIGGHTVNHPILEKIDAPAAAREIAENRDALRSLTGQTPRTFAYPNGKPQLDYSATHVRLVQEAGYEAAVSTAYGVGDAASDRYQLPRFVLNETSYPEIFLRMLRLSSHVSRDAC